MSISNVILFVSKYSDACKESIKFIILNKMHVNIIPIDSSEARKMVLSGKNLKLYSVPTLLVERSDNSIQLFIGDKKVLAWLNQIMYKISTTTNNSIQKDLLENNENNYHSEENNFQPEAESRITINKHKSKSKKKKRKKLEEFIDLPTTVSSDEDEQNENRPNSQILNNEPTQNNNQPKITGGLSTSPTSTASSKPNIMEMASRMMLERNETLGYSDNDKKY